MDFIDLKELDKKPIDEQIKIKVDIILNNDLSKIPVGYLPDVFVDEYYFISYSHLDYKLVYKDIFDLQSHGLNTWYDRGIPANQNWKDTAKKYITPFACKGVIFYLSRNSIKSDAVKDEIEFVLNCHKPFIVIVLPDDNSGESLPINIAKSLLDEGVIDNDRYSFIKDVFPNENIYLMYSQPVSNKIEKIKLLPSEPLLQINTHYTDINFKRGTYEDYNESINYVRIVIKSINDYYASSVTMKDYFDLLNYPDVYEAGKKNTLHYNPNNRITGSVPIDFHFDSAAFSNMKNLEYVEIPILKCITFDIPSYAFYSCLELKEVKFIIDEQNNSLFNIGTSAFQFCTSLEHFDFSHVSEIANGAFLGCEKLQEIIGSLGLRNIGRFAFYKCSSLKEINLGATTAKIGEEAFSYSGVVKAILPHNLVKLERKVFNKCRNLKEVVFSFCLKTIGEYAFGFCESLRKVVLPNTVKTIEKNAFMCCQSLKELKLPNSIEKIGEGAFSGCSNLTVIDFDGTVEQWKSKGFTKIFGENRRCIIYCLDDNYQYNEK